MPTEIDILNSEGKVSGKASLSDIFAAPKANKHLIHEVIRAYNANQRKGTHGTKTRSEVSGSNKKPWKQKHTGRARSGSSKSPLWKGGGIIFGPKPRSYRIDLPKTKVRNALSQVLTDKLASGGLIVASLPALDKVKTKNVALWLKKLSLPAKSLLVVDKMDQKFSLASRNLPDFEIMECRHLHPYHILGAKKVILTPEAAQCL